MQTASRSNLPLLPIVRARFIRGGKRPLFEQAMAGIILSLCGVDDPAAHRLPPERELARTLGVSVITLKRAIRELEARALVRRQHGSGNYPVRRPGLEDLLWTVKPRRLAFYSEARFHASTLMRYDLLYYMQKILSRSGTDLVLVGDHDANLSGATDGLFVCGRHDVPKSVKRPGLPIVFVGTYPGKPIHPSVQLDLEQVGREGANLFLKSGPGQVAFFGAGGAQREEGRRVRSGFRRALGNASSFFEAFGSPSAVYRAARRWLALRKGKVFLFSAYYLCTGALIRACEAKGRPIGRDVELVAFGTNNIVMQDMAPIRLLQAPREKMAEASLELMLLQILGPKSPPRTIRLPVTLS